MADFPEHSKTLAGPRFLPKHIPEKGLWPNAKVLSKSAGEVIPTMPLLKLALPFVVAAALLTVHPIGQNLAPYIPTPDDVVDRMLSFAKVTRDDVVFDLGCGDGRIPIAAARKYGARGVGLDIDPKLVELATSNAKAAGVDRLVQFHLQNVLEADVSSATVVTLYLLSSSNERLRPMLTRQLKPGARIVSHAFSMGRDWPADAIDQFVSARGDEVTLYLWKIK